MSHGNEREGASQRLRSCNSAPDPRLSGANDGAAARQMDLRVAACGGLDGLVGLVVEVIVAILHGLPAPVYADQRPAADRSRVLSIRWASQRRRY